LRDQEHTPTTEDIIAEAQRRLHDKKRPGSRPDRQNWAIKLNQGVFWLARHWLALFNILVGVYTGGAILTPVMMKFGFEGVGNMLYAFYNPFCHQYPFRSWFLFGPHMARPLTEPISVLKMNQLTQFTGNENIGYKMALCQRDIAMYGIIFVAGLVYGLLRSRKTLRPLPMWIYFVFGIVPIMLDGGIQWLSYLMWVLFPGLVAYPFETIPLMRTLTGTLFGLGIVATSYPYINEFFEDVRITLQQRFHWT